MPKNSIVRNEQTSTKSSNNQTPYTTPNKTTFSPYITVHTGGGHIGIAHMTFSDVNCTGQYLLNRKHEIIEGILQAVANARVLFDLKCYTPQVKPMMWFISDIDFGILIDVVAVSDVDIKSRADEIVNKLARDCDFSIEKIEWEKRGCEVLNA